MKKFCTLSKLVLLTLLLIAEHLVAQDNISILSNKVTLQGIINQDTFLVENVKNRVSYIDEQKYLEIVYNIDDEREITAVSERYTDTAGTIIIRFFGTYDWLPDALREDIPNVSRTDEISIVIKSIEMSVPVNISFNQINGTNGITKRMVVVGLIDPSLYNLNLPGYAFIGQIKFQIEVVFNIFQF